MHMKKGGLSMKCLKINRGIAQFRNEEGKYVDVDQIGKEDILYLLDIATDEEKEFGMDDYNEIEIKNPAQKIVYQNLSDKFKELLTNKSQFLDESEALYKEALQKYKV